MVVHPPLCKGGSRAASVTAASPAGRRTFVIKGPAGAGMNIPVLGGEDDEDLSFSAPPWLHSPAWSMFQISPTCSTGNLHLLLPQSSLHHYRCVPLLTHASIAFFCE